MAQNYVLLERIELNASAASVTFSNIPQSGYTDLKVVVSARQSRSEVTSNTRIEFNGLSTNLSCRYLQGTGSSALSSSSASYIFAESNANSSTANTFGNSEIYIPNYTSSNYKSVSWDAVTENNATAADTLLVAGLWSSTAAITSITLSSLSSDSFLQYSTFSLYGLAAVGTTPVIAPKASGGNITTDGTYWIHTFLTTQAFTPFTNLTCDYLVVAGGGGAGGSGVSGGGGAGGLRSTVTATGGGGSLESALSVTAQAYTITVGGGGAAGASNTNGTNGTNSVFSTITSTGGGGGGRQSPYSGNTGGSGGGGYYTGSGGAGTANQGYAGGAGHVSENSGGGGGANAVGASAGALSAGNGGSGVSVSITGSSVTYAGGGGGGAYYSSSQGTGGSGGGGAGAILTTTNSTAGTTNLGGGAGGGQGSDGTTKAGGSGIVIIRYTIA